MLATKQHPEDQGFDSWKERVDLEIVRMSGVSLEDLPDVLYHDWYDEGYTPKEAAIEAIAYSQE